MRVVNILYTKL